MSGMMPRPKLRAMKRPEKPALRRRSEVSASSVMHHSSHPPISTEAARRKRPMVPAKMMEFRSLRDGIAREEVPVGVVARREVGVPS